MCKACLLHRRGANSTVGDRYPGIIGLAVIAVQMRVMTMRSHFILPSACVLGLALLSGGSAVAQTGALTQLPGTDACVSEDGTGGACADGVGLNGANSVAASPDGRNVYVASFLSSAVAVFARDDRTGALTQRPGTDACVSEDGSGGDCADGVGLAGANEVAVSRDGRNVYVASIGSFTSTVAVFARDRRTGALTQLPGTDACISEDGSGGDCTAIAEGVTVSPDGRNVYVPSLGSSAVAVFARDRNGPSLAVAR
jgi:DNA-binding beta-propeller fold protein YncE